MLQPNYQFPGKLITFCGIDGSGKTSIIAKCKDYFLKQDKEVVLTRQPTTEFRNRPDFRAFVDGKDFSPFDFKALTLAADRLQHVNKFIIPQLQHGNIVISDRYFYSCLANHRAMGYTKDAWIDPIMEEFFRPDLAFFLDIPVALAVKRIRRRPTEKNRYIDVEYQEKLRHEYLYIANQFNGIVVPSETSVAQTFRHIQTYL